MLKAATNFFKPTQECPEVALEPRRNLSNDICIVACGDFSGLQQRFQELQGVDRVVVGYTGGKKEKPTSDKLHGHCEALFIEFQPNVISYRQILDEWKQCGDPWEPEKSQYRSALFWKSLPQQNIAFQFVEELQSEHPGKKLYTEVERIHKFYMAKQPCQLVELMPKAEGNEIAVVACGSFLGPQQRFQELGGVERVIMGYTGGKKDNPKNHKPYDHSEALLIEFNPTVLSYHRILELWSELDDPFTEDERQYRSAVFWKTLGQQDTAIQFIERLQTDNPSKQLYINVERVHKFYEVEQFYDYDHQIQKADSPHLGARKEVAMNQTNQTP